ncbi:MAG: hypothetical protein LBK76_06165 [Verrucomicrobiales bacterium]|nr:hypothetical protein [Verrucomicrobiales bacterium]
MPTTKDEVQKWLGAERAAKLEREHPGAIAGGLLAFPNDVALAALKALTLAGGAPSREDLDLFHGKIKARAGETMKNAKLKKQN